MPTPQQPLTIRGQVKEQSRGAQRLVSGIRPSWPIHIRDHLWDVLEREGLGMLDLDDLNGVSKRSWKGQH